MKTKELKTYSLINNIIDKATKGCGHYSFERCVRCKPVIKRKLDKLKEKYGKDIYILQD